MLSVKMRHFICKKQPRGDGMQGMPEGMRRGGPPVTIWGEQ